MPVDGATTVHRTFRSRVESGARAAPEGELARFGPITVASLGAGHPLLNSALIFEAPAPDELVGSIEWMDARDVPFFVWAADAALDRVDPAAHGLRKRNDVPGMVRPGLGSLPAAETDATLEEVTDGDAGAEFWRVFRTVFDVPADPEVRRTMVASAVGERCRSYVGRLDGRAVAAGAAFEADGAANVWGMATLEAYRGRGIGTAICREVLRAARGDGCRAATLEAAPAAVPLYESLGFETAVSYRLFELEQ